ncbi:hypothetical protein [Tumebacillus flagellatus]|uniref:hypothetical protein n=1 Tax=Tumebacillus flagellatus TaxID=1157490 RepID=UPI001378A718|nr:hypothetical protein [Tumebacillus flagellatus]
MQKHEALTDWGKVEVEVNGDVLSVAINGELYRTMTFGGPNNVTSTIYANQERV